MEPSLCVVVNTEDSTANEFKLPEGLWALVFDEKGLVDHRPPRLARKKLSSRPRRRGSSAKLTKPTDKV
ncbi:MAG: hypothetical protein QM796_17755 [Chthoniobacteraceae bacterium]